MSLFEGAPSVVTDKTAQNELTAISREAFNDYQTRFAPVENQLAARINNPGVTSARIDEARRAAEQGYVGQREGALIEAGRYGGLRQDERAKFNKVSQIYGQAAVADAANRAGRGIEGEQLDALVNFIGQGRGLQSGAISGLQNALQLENQRNQTAYSTAQQKAQGSAGLTNTLINTGITAGALALSASAFKKDIDDVLPEDMLEIVDKLRPVIFRYTEYGCKVGGYGDGFRFGVIADDVPDEFKPDARAAVDPMSFIGALIGAVQEISKRIGLLSEELDRLSWVEYCEPELKAGGTI